MITKIKNYLKYAKSQFLEGFWEGYNEQLNKRKN